MKKYKKTIILILLIVIVLSIFKYIMENRYPSVRYAISMREAQEVIEKNYGYYLIKDEGLVTGSYFRFEYGDKKGKGVLLSPSIYEDLSVVFSFFSGGNTFLVKGDLKEEYNNITYEPYNYTIYLEDWEIVSPIKRNYDYTKHIRFFYPKDYIDEYDVKHGDYTP